MTKVLVTSPRITIPFFLRFFANPVIDWGNLNSIIQVLTHLSILDTLKDTLRIMENPYLIHRKTGSSYLSRSAVPFDLQPLLEFGQFQLSLGCGILDQSKILSFHLNTITQFLYNLIRENPEMKKLTISGIKEILKIELEKSKRHVHHYYLGTNRFSETDRLKSLLNNQEQEEQS